MSDKKISQFTELTAPSTGDFLPVVDVSSSTTKKIKLSDLPVSNLSESKANPNTTDFQGATETSKVLTSIPNSGFKNNTNLTSVYIGSNVTNIGASAFEYCSNLTEAFITHGTTGLGVKGFQGCTGLNNGGTFSMPNSITSIGNQCFQASKFHNINFSNNLEIIGASAFEGCALTGVTIPDSVTGIGAGGFDLSFSLTGVTIGSGLTGASSIGAETFSLFSQH